MHFCPKWSPLMQADAKHWVYCPARGHHYPSQLAATQGRVPGIMRGAQHPHSPEMYTP